MKRRVDEETGDVQVLQEIRPFLSLFFILYIGFVGYIFQQLILSPFILSEGGFLGSEATVGERLVFAGALLSLYPLGQFFGAPLLGGWADRVGTRLVFLVTVAISAVMAGLMAMALEGEFLWVLVAALFLGGFCEAHLALTQTAISKYAQGLRRAKLLGWSYGVTSLAFATGPVFGWIFGSDRWGYGFHQATPFWVLMGLILVAWVVLWVTSGKNSSGRYCPWESEPSGAVGGGGRKPLRGLPCLEVFRDRRVRRVYGLNFLSYLVVYGIWIYTTLFLTEAYGAGLFELMIALSVLALSLCVSTLTLVPWALKRYSLRENCILSAFLSGIFLVVAAFPWGMMWTLGVLIGFHFFVALWVTAGVGVIAAKVDVSEQGCVMGNNYAMRTAAVSLSAVAGAVLGAMYLGLPQVVFAILAWVVAWGFGTVEEG